MLRMGTDLMRVSKKDIIALIVVASLVLIYFFSEDKRDWIAITIVISAGAWLSWKFEQVYLARSSAQGIYPEIRRLESFKSKFRQGWATNVLMATYASLYILACFILHQTIILAAIVVTVFVILIVPRALNYVRRTPHGPAE